MGKRNLDTRFVWCKPETAFIWIKTKGGPQLQWPREKKGGHTVWYRPPLSLFRIFADLKSDPKAAGYHILSFANQYGDILGRPGGEYYQLDEAAIAGRSTVRPYAAPRLWMHQIRQMQWVVGLWDQCNDDRLGNAARKSARQELQMEIESALSLDTLLKYLNTNTNIRLHRLPPSWTRVGLNTKLELFLEPVNLLAFMWLTLARLASGEILERPCMGGCGEYIYTGIGPGLKKTGTTTCSPACRKSKERRERMRRKS